MNSAYIDCTEFGESVITPQMRALIPTTEIFHGDPDPDELNRRMRGAIGIINGRTSMDEAMLRRYPDLKTIVFLGTGASSYIDVAAADRLGIKIRTVRGYGDRTIAEHAFAMMLAAARNLAEMDRQIRRDEWHLPVATDLGGKRLGVIGTGGIGGELVRMAAGFGMEVVAWNRSGVSSDLPCQAVELDELLTTSDVVSLHLALTDATRHFLDRTKLEMLRPDALLINVARGGLIDEAAMVDLLRQNRIAHAALDVFEQEPLPDQHPLKLLENVTLTSHAAYKSREAMVRLLTGGFEHLRADLDALAADTLLSA